MDCQAPLSMGIPRQEYCSGLPFPSLGDLPDPGIEPVSPESPALAGRFFSTLPPGKPWWSEGWTFSPILLTSSEKREAGGWINSSDWWFNQTCLCNEACIKIQKDSAHFSSIYTKIGTMQRLSWLLPKDDMWIHEVFHVFWCNHYGEQYGDSLKKLEIKIPYDLTIPLLGK